MTQAEHSMIPAERARVEIRVVNSRFIGSIAPVASVAEARAFIAEVRATMPDASHHVYAYVIGHGASTTLGMSDDGEPSGTAGRPVLAVLKGSRLGDAALVVTRYFGGTLLGTGGLVHAYGDAARAVLAAVARAEKIERCTLLVRVPYASYEQARRLVEAHQGTIETEEFTTDVRLLVVLPRVSEPGFQAALVDATAGSATIEPVEG